MDKAGTYSLLYSAGLIALHVRIRPIWKLVQSITNHSFFFFFFFFVLTLVGTVLSYVFYWLAVIVALVYTKYKEVYKYFSSTPPFVSENHDR